MQVRCFAGTRYGGHSLQNNNLIKAPLTCFEKSLASRSVQQYPGMAAAAQISAPPEPLAVGHSHDQTPRLVR